MGDVLLSSIFLMIAVRSWSSGQNRPPRHDSEGGHASFTAASWSSWRFKSSKMGAAFMISAFCGSGVQ